MTFRQPTPHQLPTLPRISLSTRPDSSKTSAQYKSFTYLLTYLLAYVSLKTRFLGLHFRCRKYLCIFNHFYAIRPESYRILEITLRLGLLRRSSSSKVTEFGTNRKLICDFLLVVNSNLAPILHRFRDIAFDRSKIAIFGYPSCVYLPCQRGSLGTVSLKFYLDVNGLPWYQTA